MVRRLDELRVLPGLDEPRRSKLTVDTMGRRREEIDIDEAPCAARVAQRDLRSFIRTSGPSQFTRIRSRSGLTESMAKAAIRASAANDSGTVSPNVARRNASSGPSA